MTSSSISKGSIITFGNPENTSALRKVCVIRQTSETVWIKGKLRYFPRGARAVDIRFYSLAKPLLKRGNGPRKSKPWKRTKGYICKRGTEFRLALARAIRMERKADSLAGRIARQRANFHLFGRVALETKTSGEVVSRKQARELQAANKRRTFIANVSDGTGRELDAQAIEEMKLAARAVLLAGGDIKAASKAAKSELYHATREAVYDDPEKATQARDKALRQARDAWEDEDCKPCERQPHNAEFFDLGETEEHLNPRSIMAARLWRARKAFRAKWKASNSNFAKAKLKEDFRAVRALARDIANGDYIPLEKWRDDETESQRLRRLGERAQEGFALLAKQAQPAKEQPARTPKRAKAETVAIPSTRLEVIAHDLRTETPKRQAFARLQANRKASADECESLAGFTFRMK